MASQIVNYQCPACGGPLGFSGEEGKLVCEYCESRYDVAEIEVLYEEKEAAAAQAQADPDYDPVLAGDWTEEEAAHMRAYSCPSCGAELICDDTTAATSCPYCDNPTIVPGQFSGGMRPEWVIPFKVSKDEAVAALKGFYKGKRFLPNSFISGNKLEEVKGVYVPFWLFDGNCDADMTFSGKIVKTRTEGDERVTTTDYYELVRRGDMAFEKIPVKSSSKMPEEHMDAIEPYQYEDLATFSTAYLPGYLADKYDQEADECSVRVEERISESATDALTNTTTRFSDVRVESSQIDIDKAKPAYAMLPVWMLSTRWQDQTFLFAINGQTGKLVGNLPVSKSKVAMWFGGISLPLMLILFLLLF